MKTAAGGARRLRAIHASSDGRRLAHAASTSPRAVGGRAVGCGWMTDLFSVAGKTALVTGGSRGIGLMIARGLVDAGARVYICLLYTSDAADE